MDNSAAVSDVVFGSTIMRSIIMPQPAVVAQGGSPWISPFSQPSGVEDGLSADLRCQF
jgi:hypothetical protein